MNTAKNQDRSLSRFSHLGSNKWAKLNQTIENGSVQRIAKQATIAIIAIALVIISMLLLPF